jgi:hypothetical protein
MQAILVLDFGTQGSRSHDTRALARPLIHDEDSAEITLKSLLISDHVYAVVAGQQGQNSQ